MSALTGKTLVWGPAVPGGPHTFIETIEQILQNRLAETPLSSRSVHLRSGKDGRLEIEVDGTIYGDLEGIEDKAVRDAIQSSVDEWQRSTI